MCGRGSQPDHVEQRATANSDHVTVAVDVVHFDFRLDFRDVKVRVLRAFPSLELHRVANQVQAILANRKVLLDLIDQPGLGAAQGFVHHDQHLVNAIVLAVDECVTEQCIVRSKQILCE